jgi:thymidylate kinase
MAKIEAHLYSNSLNHHPDIVFKLIADARTIDARKPSKATIKMLETKVEGIKKLEFAHSCKVITIDATQPLDEVLYKVKKELWEVLSQVDH